MIFDCSLVYTSLLLMRCLCLTCFFFNAPATTEIYTLSLHDALPISRTLRAQHRHQRAKSRCCGSKTNRLDPAGCARIVQRSEEHTSELQSRRDLVCRLLLEKKNNKANTRNHSQNSSICLFSNLITKS